MSFGRTDPGECPICGAAHSACGGGGPITVVQLPARDAALAGGPVSEAPAATSPLGDGSDGRPFSSSTYRGTKKRP